MHSAKRKDVFAICTLYYLVIVLVLKQRQCTVSRSNSQSFREQSREEEEADRSADNIVMTQTLTDT